MVIASLQHVTQLQRIAQAHISIAITVAGMKLDRKLLLCRYFEGDMKQILDERFMSNAQLPGIYGLCASLFKSRYCCIFLPLSDIQASTIGDNTFQAATALLARLAHLIRETSNDLVKITVLNHQTLHPRFQPEQFSRPASADRAHLLRRVARFRWRITRIKDKRIDIGCL